MTDGAPAPRRTLAIRILNDEFRKNPLLGKFVMTRGVASLALTLQALLLREVVEYADDRFNPDNDPWGEHDFGVVEALGQKAFWKIDVYSKDMKFGSPDPGNRDVSRRVLTLYLPEEH